MHPHTSTSKFYSPPAGCRRCVSLLISRKRQQVQPEAVIGPNSLLSGQKRNIYIFLSAPQMFFFSLKNPEGSGWTKSFSSHRGAVIPGLVISGPAAESNETQTHPRGSQQLHAAPAAPRLRELAFMPQHKNLFTDPLA